MKILVGAAVTACVVAAACATVPTTGARASADPRFDWFEYQGHDSVYSVITRGPEQYSNPILAGFYPDPSITRVGSEYYLVTSSFAYFPGVPIFRSRDLVSWQQIGSVLDRRSQLNLDSAGISRGIFAPVIRYHDGRFYMITTLVDRGGNFFVTATNAAGPWSDPVWLPSVDGIDPSFFFDDNGKAYVINNGPPIEPPRYSGHRAIWIQEFDVASQKMVGPRTMIVNGGVDPSRNPIWIEAPHIFRRDNLYYLICAEGGTADQHSEVVFRSASPWGPWTPHTANPILTQRHLADRPFPITSTGHADFVETPAGEWWAVFLGTRPYGNDTYNIGRETFLLPVTWRDGWPSILAGNATVPYVAGRAKLERDTAVVPAMSGNFTWRDEFDASHLGMMWQTIRGPGDAFVDLTSSPGALTLHTTSVGFDLAGQPSFVGRRQQHLAATATTSMTWTPPHDGDEAGLIAFQNERFYYFLALTRAGRETRVVVERRAGGPPVIVASVPVRLVPGAPLQLRISARAAQYDFAYAVEPGQWRPLLTGADGSILSTKVAGGFVGTMLGLYTWASPERPAQ